MTKIIIIGAGVAGLSAGIYGLINGYEVSIYERHYKAGGNLTGWDREGYHIDNCIHWLTGTNPNTSLYKIWNELNVINSSVNIEYGDRLFSYKRKDKIVSLYNDFDKTKKEMLHLAPEDEKEIESFFKAIESIEKIEGIYNGNESVLDKIKSFPFLMKYYFLSTKELSNKFKNEIIKGFFVSIMGEDFSALALIIVFATFLGGNGGIPSGGSCQMAKRMEEKFISKGGNLYLKSEVSKINVNKDKVESIVLKNGKIVRGDYIIITGDVGTIFSKLLDYKYMPKRLKKQFKNPKMIRFSSYHCAYSCNLKQLPFKGDLVLQVPYKYRNLLKNKYIILREFSYQKSLSLENKSILQVMAYCYEKEAKEFINLSKNKEKYKMIKEEIANAIKEIIVGEFTSLEGNLKVIDVWTPFTYKRYTDAQVGSFMSFILPPRVIPTATTNKIKGLANAFLASQWLRIPGGLPIAAQVGKEAIESILKINK